MDVRLYYCKTCPWATSGYCPVSTRHGCVEIGGYCKGPIEQMVEIINKNNKIEDNYMKDFEQRMLEELKELEERKGKLLKALNEEEIENTVGTKQYCLMQWQYSAMHSYYNALIERCIDLGLVYRPEV